MDNGNRGPAVHFVQAGFSGGQRKPGVNLAPKVILDAMKGLEMSVSIGGLDSNSIAALEAEFPRQKVGSIHNLRLTTEVNRRLKEEIEGLQGTGKIVVLGGDHSIAVGSISGLCAREPDLKVVWVDAHADINTLDSTVSGNLHGCPVAFLLGLENTRMDWLRPCLNPSNLLYVGLRDVEPQEERLLERLGIARYNMQDVRRLGMDRVVREIGEFVGNAPLHVSLDVDGLDPEYMGATGTPVSGGLTYADTSALFHSLLSKHWISLDIVEVNPLLGSTEDQANTLHHTTQLLGTFLSH